MKPKTHDAAHQAGHQPEPELESQRSFWTSKSGLVTFAFLLIAAFFLLSEHRAHTLGVLPFLLLLACPLLHMFMHRGHGTHVEPKGSGTGAQNGPTSGQGA